MIFECRSFRKGFSSAFFFFILFCFFCTQSRSQIVDSIRASLEKKPRLIGGLATKNTFINGFRSPIYTARVGLDFDNRIRTGIGISWLKLSKYDSERDNTPFYLDKYLVDLSGGHTLHPALQFRYINLFIDYVYYKSGKWQFCIPIQLGVGDSRYKYDLDGKKVVESKHVVLLYEPAVSGQYKITKWFGAGLDVGYRIMILNNDHIGSKFNSPMYNIKAIIFWEELYQTIVNKP